MGVLTGRRGAGYLAPLLIAGISLAGGETPESAPAASHSEHDIESAMLYNFTKFVEWPDRALGENGSSLVVGVLGDDPMTPVLAAALQNKTIYGHPILVLRLSSNADLKTCAVLLVGSSDRKEIARIVQSVGRAPVLTIGEQAQFSRLGGVIAFIRDGSRIRFEINPDAADRAGLQVSSKLLRLADVWREPAGRPRN
jgi:hypothetical protein